MDRAKPGLLGSRPGGRLPKSGLRVEGGEEVPRASPVSGAAPVVEIMSGGRARPDMPPASGRPDGWVVSAAEASVTGPGLVLSGGSCGRMVGRPGWIRGLVGPAGSSCGVVAGEVPSLFLGRKEKGRRGARLAPWPVGAPSRPRPKKRLLSVGRGGEIPRAALDTREGRKVIPPELLGVNGSSL